MKQRNLSPLVALCGLALIAASLAPALAAEKTPFYQGKTLNIVINFAAGGPTDIESRVLAKHLVKHIPGQPAITIQAMGGGGGVTAINYMGEVAKRDGFSAGYFTGSLFHHQTREPSLRVDLSKFGFITGIHAVTASYIRADVPPGIKKPADLMKAQRFRAAGLVSPAPKTSASALLRPPGAKYDYVTGYNSSSDARLAVQRNEAQYHDETLPGFRTAVEPQMVKTGMVTPLYIRTWYLRKESQPQPDVPELLPFTDFTSRFLAKPPPVSNTRH
jgi:hypothetical protein